MQEKEYYFWLHSRDGIGNIKRAKLLKYFGTAKEVFRAKKEQLEEVKGITANDIVKITKERNEEIIHRRYEDLLKRGISFILRGENEYPECLKNIYDSPDALYLRGKFPNKIKKAIAIVGARNCSNYGIEMANYFGNELAKAGIEIISGLARGIDTAAHKGALKALEGATYAVLGCGIDRCYPIENLELFLEMEKRGGIISEFGIGVSPKAGNFPMRNRIISGLCDGILVIEAKEKSGSLITASLGLEQGKDIFSLPGRSCDVLSKGCNNLIKQGGFLVDSPEDIIEFYGVQWNTIWKENEISKKFLDLRWEMVYSDLSLEPKHITCIMEDTKLSLAEIMEVLLALEMRGYVKKISGNYYVLAIN